MDDKFYHPMVTHTTQPTHTPCVRACVMAERTYFQLALIIVLKLISLQVTGGNRGIGFCIVKQLSKQFDGVIILTGKLSITLATVALHGRHAIYIIIHFTH